eukprot:70346-Amphidinium_carterae.1
MSTARQTILSLPNTRKKQSKRNCYATDEKLDEKTSPWRRSLVIELSLCSSDISLSANPSISYIWCALAALRAWRIDLELERVMLAL